MVDARIGPAQPPRIRRSRVWRPSQLLVRTLVLIALLVTILPLAWMVLTALKPEADVISAAPIGSRIEWGNFRRAWNYLPFGGFLLNSLLVAAAGTALTLVVSTMAGYAFARFRFRGSKVLFALYIATLMIPQEVIVIPEFLLVTDLHGINSYWALIVPWAFGAFGVFLIRQFFLTIPRDYEEAARIDGASRFRAFLVVLPLVGPALAVLGVFTFVAYWNSFLWPLIVVNSVRRATIPLGLDMFIGQVTQASNLQMAGATISVIPSVIALLIAARWLRRGIVLSGLGGR